MAWVDAAKGISILLVVVHHVVDALHASGQAPSVVVAGNTALAALRMPLFFLASGLFVAGPLGSSWRTVLHKRVLFFLYLYCVWTLLRFAFFQIPAMAAADPSDAADLTEVVWALLLPSSGLWFLYALAVFSVVGKLLTRVPWWLSLTVACVLSAFVGAEVVQFENEAWTRMARYLFFFLLGWHARHLIERLATATSSLWVGGAACGCVAVAVGSVVLGIRTVPGVALALNILAVTFGVVFAAWISRYRVGRPLVLLGGRTLPVYLLHFFGVAAAMAALAHLAPAGLPPVVAFMVPVVLPIGLVMLSLLTHRLLMRARATWLFALPRALAHRPATGRSA